LEKQLKIKVFGRVQGVYFRQSTKVKAEDLGLCGIVMNEVSGNVYIEVRGEESDLDLFVIFCKIGPPRAAVDNVIIEETELSPFNGFSILR
jgi:acylphosphatase